MVVHAARLLVNRETMDDRMLHGAKLGNVCALRLTCTAITLAMPKEILVLGHGHLAFRILRSLRQQGYPVTHRPALPNSPTDLRTPVEKLAQLLDGHDLSQVAMAYVLDDSDERNLELLLALISISEEICITAALFNESIIPHFEAAHPRLKIFNPARLAAPAFVAALYEKVQRPVRPVAPVKPRSLGKPPADRLVPGLLLGFLVLILGSAFFYHFFEGLSWINSLYFVVVTVTTVGYGDINLLGSDAGSKLFGIALILISTVFIWLIFSLTIHRILRQREELAKGHRKYGLRNHIVLCGLGRLGYFIATELHRRSEKFIVIEMNESVPHIEYLRNHGVSVYIGNARLARVLRDAGAADAKAVVSVIDNDLGNLEIGLNARSLQPGIRTILRVFDDSMAQVLKEKLDIHLSLSTSSVAESAFLGTMKPTTKQ
ncbi:MAG: hypothetical protein EOO08_11205 [Chitinophagaceae bacterium]|nr:MAG: hypothetical protein EOO08_11205 [Chitinophagaceae bacterium]